MELKGIVYIAGYGRSGSTLVERILSAHEYIVGLGELAYLSDSEYADLLWPKAVAHPFWLGAEPFLRLRGDRLRQVSRMQLRNESIVWSLLRGLRYFSNDYLCYQSGLFSRLSNILPPRVKYIIDSSKTARNRFGRPHALSNLPGGRIKVIHLIRDPRGCLASLRKGSNNEMEGLPSSSRKWLTFRVYLGWLMSNVSVSLYLARNNEDVLTVFFEDLLENPIVEIARLGRFLEIDMGHVARRVAEGQGIPSAPQFAGNRMRVDKAISLHAPQSNYSGMGIWDRFLYAAIGAPMMRIYRQRAAIRGLCNG